MNRLIRIGRVLCCLLAFLVLTVANILMAVFYVLHIAGTGRKAEVFPLVKSTAPLKEAAAMDEWIDALAEKVGDAIPDSPKVRSIAGRTILGRSITPAEAEAGVAAAAAAAQEVPF